MTGVCLWAGTLAGHDLWTRIRAAGNAGFSSISVAPCELAAVVAHGDGQRLDDELRGHRVRLACLDPVVAWLPHPVPAHPAHRVHAAIGVTQCLELADRFAIRLANVIDVTWRALPSAAAEHLATFTERAGRQRLAVVVEAQVYSAIPSLPAAIDLCRQAGPQVRLLVDAWHFSRDRTARTDDLDEVGVGALQLADGPARPGADPVVESITGRLLPGRGSFDLTELAARVQRDRVGDCLVGPEVFTEPVPTDRVDEVAANALAATRHVLRRGRKALLRTR